MVSAEAKAQGGTGDSSRITPGCRVGCLKKHLKKKKNFKKKLKKKKEGAGVQEGWE